MMDVFKAGMDVDGCVGAVERVNALAGQAFDAFRDGGVACRSGCSFCCHLRVMVRPHEAIALHRALGARLPAAQAAQVRGRVLQNALRIRGQGGECSDGRTAAGTPRMTCAFLVNGACSVYAMRPFACASFHSLDRAGCELAHQRAGHAGEAGAGIPMLQGLRVALQALDEEVDRQLARCGLSGERIELHAALAALMKKPALIARWRSGRRL